MDSQISITEDRMFLYVYGYITDKDVDNNKIEKLLRKILNETTIEDFINGQTSKWELSLTSSTDSLHTYIYKDVCKFLQKCTNDDEKRNVWMASKYVYIMANKVYPTLPQHIDIGNGQCINITVKSLFHIMFGHHLSPEEASIPNPKKDNFKSNFNYIHHLKYNAIKIFSKVPFDNHNKNTIDYKHRGQLIRMIIEPDGNLVTIYPLSKGISNRIECKINCLLSVYLPN